MTEVVIVEAVRTPVGRRGGGLSTVHPADLLADRAAGARSSGPASIRPRSARSSAGCVSQVGEQAFNIARTAWLAAGLPLSRPATTVDTQCGSIQQATNLATSLVGSGVVDVAVACGVEVMSRIPIGSTRRSEARPRACRSRRRTSAHYEMTSQFEGAERIAEKWGITRDDTDAFGLASQRARRASLGRGPLRHPDRRGRRARSRRGGQADRLDPSRRAATRGCGRRRSRRSPSSSPSARENGVHTAGSSSQISDGAAAVLLMTAERAPPLGLTPEGPHRRHLPRRRRSGPDADRADRRHQAAVRAHRASTIERHGHRRDQRGLRLGRAGVGQGGCTPTWRR